MYIIFWLHIICPDQLTGCLTGWTTCVSHVIRVYTCTYRALCHFIWGRENRITCVEKALWTCYYCTCTCVCWYTITNLEKQHRQYLLTASQWHCGNIHTHVHVHVCWYCLPSSTKSHLNGECCSLGRTPLRLAEGRTTVTVSNTVNPAWGHIDLHGRLSQRGHY